MSKSNVIALARLKNMVIDAYDSLSNRNDKKNTKISFLPDKVVAPIVTEYTRAYESDGYGSPVGLVYAEARLMRERGPHQEWIAVGTNNDKSRKMGLEKNNPSYDLNCELRLVRVLNVSPDLFGFYDFNRPNIAGVFENRRTRAHPLVGVYRDGRILLAGQELDKQRLTSEKLISMLEERLELVPRKTETRLGVEQFGPYPIETRVAKPVVVK